MKQHMGTLRGSSYQEEQKAWSCGGLQTTGAPNCRGNAIGRHQTETPNSSNHFFLLAFFAE
jgi:hypothetical protein